MAKNGGKIDRNRKWCEQYRAAQKHEKSHVRRIVRHLARHGAGDAVAVAALARYRAGLGSMVRKAKE